ncbi:response regulator [Paenibacillus dendritiformis]|uniref:LytR/AlgR family response regulator transcription factor n=1 Tax=Paenibacillus dendritiformis TaxID=130049 RepID=UPI00143D63CB|nr:LytTR family transcriptional regulator DNA-binding domain-containing protein [Paenibacillus dendritiformis]NKI23507.1 response regulator [Paenibacillus dendritiformis]NRG00488.1 LytTR family transcriptional regulator DNA-binding domain-containing protein [Paenibacillus dendritiformis]
MLKAFVVDDEPLARDELIYLLKRTRQVEVVGEADAAEDALAGVAAAQPDVVFLDIELQEESGLDIACRLRELETPPDVVFATAYDEFALKAFELNAADYILKPFDEQRVQQTIRKLLRLREREAYPASAASAPRGPGERERQERLAITVDERIIVLHVNDIVYLGFEDGKTVIATTERKYKVGESLTQLERKLNHPSIVRVHRAFLVHLDRIVEIQPWFHSTCHLRMQDGSRIPVSRTYMKELKQLLGMT